MKHQKIEIFYQEFSSYLELEEADRSLFRKAVNARQNAYAPYSLFKVGAAVLLANGKVVSGNNQENIAYPSGLCAERVAMFAASSNYPNVPVKAVAIAAEAISTEEDTVLTPCGSCRQVLAEYEQLYQQPIRIIVGAVDAKVLIIDGITSLLPFMFFDKGLKKL